MLERHELVLYSRSRQQLWVKGEISGNRILVDRVVTDCDRDALLVFGRPTGPRLSHGGPELFSPSTRRRPRGLPLPSDT